MFATRIIIAIIIGTLIGAVINGLIINFGLQRIPLPSNVNFETEQGLFNFQFLGIKHFIFPFLAHSIGTLTGSIAAILIAGRKKLMVVLVVSGLYFLGGLWMVMITNAPVWFENFDLIVAYFPFGLLSLWLLRDKKVTKSEEFPK